MWFMISGRGSFPAETRLIVFRLGFLSPPAMCATPSLPSLVAIVRSSALGTGYWVLDCRSVSVNVNRGLMSYVIQTFLSFFLFSTKFILGSPMAHGGAARAPPPPFSTPHSSPAVGEEPPILLACLQACQEDIVMLKHSPTDRHAWFARPGPSWLVASPSLHPPLPPSRQADRCNVGALGARERQRGRGKGGQGAP